MKELLKRSVTGLIFVGLVIGSVYVHPAVFGLLFLVFCFLGLKEFLRMSGFRGNRLAFAAVLATGCGIFCLVLLYYMTGFSLSFLSGIILLLLHLVLMAVTDPSRFVVNLSLGYFGFAYVVIPFSILVLMLHPLQASGSFDPRVYTGYFILLWSFDVGAYATGKAIGRHKMAERISPGKTWEGFAGGALLAAISCYLTGRYSGLLDHADWYIILLIIILTGTAGDLFESLLKRRSGIKDSGNILPGHGGVLDRFDSVLFSAPVVYFYLLVKHQIA